MKSKRKMLSEEEIDQIVIGQADNTSAWEKPVKVRKPKTTSLSLPHTLASRAAFFARLQAAPKGPSLPGEVLEEA